VSRQRRASARGRSAVLSPERREQLLQFLRDGHDLEAAAANAGVVLEAVQRDAELLAKCSACYRLGTARLRTRLLEGALKSGDVHVLERAIAAREAAGRELFCSTAPDRADGDFDLTRLSDDELELVEACLSGDHARVNAMMRQHAQTHVDALRRDLLEEIERHAVGGERAPAAEILPPARSRPRHPEALEVADPERPLPARRSLVVPEPAAPPSRQGGRLPKALGDPASPWFDGGEYPP
jgi:hypothetical protein